MLARVGDHDDRHALSPDLLRELRNQADRLAVVFGVVGGADGGTRPTRPYRLKMCGGVERQLRGEALALVPTGAGASVTGFQAP